jgi:3-deoxy-D-manno-octulosonic-acid transferase
MRGYLRLRCFLPGFPISVQAFLVQDEVHRDRLLELGIRGERIRVAGNLKFDNVSALAQRQERPQIRESERISEAALLLVAGSTHRGEEALLLEAYSDLRKRFPGLRLWLAPRHPERKQEVSDLLEKSGFSWELRSSPRREGGVEVLLIDTMGELQRIYAAADIAMVGGTLVPVGGHNLLEPVAHAVPLVVGPHLDTVRAVGSELMRAGALRVVSNVPELVSAFEYWLKDDATRRSDGLAGRALLARHRGATETTMETLLGLLAERGQQQES